MEIWKDVKNYEGLYQVSDYGNIRRYRKIRLRDSLGHFKGWGVLNDVFDEHFINEDVKGYLYTMFCKNGKSVKHRIHRIVLITFSDTIGETCDHIDNNKKNNKLTNLQWLSNGDNFRKNNSGDDHWTRRIGISDEHKKRLIRYGHHSEETKLKMSISAKNRSLKNKNNPPNYGDSI